MYLPPPSAAGRDDIVVFPLHGFRKMIGEGFRTRDAHLIEWLARLVAPLGSVEVISRPEPKVLSMPRRFTANATSPAVMNIRDHSVDTWMLPRLTDRRRWWVNSAKHYERPRSAETAPAVIWNPFIAVSNVSATIFNRRRLTIADLLDDWTVHYAFASIRDEVERAYKRLFLQVDHVTANSEGTAELARRLGRTDVELLTNGVDPEQFSHTSCATGQMTVGYVGKIGRRLDLDLVRDTARALRSVRFIFAGPILDPGYRRPLGAEANIELIGDVHYKDMPSLLTRFDIGWVPHRVGDFEIGGDILKTYEYRAAGLTVLTTPVRGAGERGLTSVKVADARDHAKILADFAACGPRVPRDHTQIPTEHTWEIKARRILKLAGLS